MFTRSQAQSLGGVNYGGKGDGKKVFDQSQPEPPLRDTGYRAAAAKKLQAKKKA